MAEKTVLEEENARLRAELLKAAEALSKSAAEFAALRDRMVELDAALRIVTVGTGGQHE